MVHNFRGDWARFLLNSDVHSNMWSGFTCSLYAQGDHYGNIRQVAGGSDDNLSEKMHRGSVTDHSHAQHVANHSAPPYPDPLCSDGAPSDSLQSLLSSHGPPRKHVNFSHPNWQVKIGSPGLKNNASRGEWVSKSLGARFQISCSLALRIITVHFK